MAGFTSLLTFVILVAVELTTHTDGNSVNTKMVPIETVPFQVRIEFNNEHLCSGSIVSSKFVLTAGNCVKDPLTEYRVYAGLTTENTSESVHLVQRAIPYSDYNKQNRKGFAANNIALLEVNPHFNFDKTLAKIPLSEEEPKDGSAATAVGWGKALHDFDNPFTLQKQSVVIINKDECREAIKGVNEVQENEICASFAGENFIYGTSGGPLVVDGVQVGIVSWALLSTNSNMPDVYTNVAKYKSWIKNYISDI